MKKIHLHNLNLEQKHYVQLRSGSTVELTYDKVSEMWYHLDNQMYMNFIENHKIYKILTRETNPELYL